MAKAQEIVEKRLAKAWARRWKISIAEAEEETSDIRCEKTRKRLLNYARWLEKQAEGLKRPIACCEILLEDEPDDIVEIINDAMDLGRMGKAEANRRKRSR